MEITATTGLDYILDRTPYLPSPSDMDRLVAEWKRVRREGKVYAGHNVHGLWYHGANGNPESTGLMTWADVREDICRDETTETTCRADAEADGER
jgi:hypothetical protein